MSSDGSSAERGSSGLVRTGRRRGARRHLPRTPPSTSESSDEDPELRRASRCRIVKRRSTFPTSSSSSASSAATAPSQPEAQARTSARPRLFPRQEATTSTSSMETMYLLSPVEKALQAKSPTSSTSSASWEGRRSRESQPMSLRTPSPPSPQVSPLKLSPRGSPSSPAGAAPSLPSQDAPSPPSPLLTPSPPSVQVSPLQQILSPSTQALLSILEDPPEVTSPRGPPLSLPQRQLAPTPTQISLLERISPSSQSLPASPSLLDDAHEFIFPLGALPSRSPAIKHTPSPASTRVSSSRSSRHISPSSQTSYVWPTTRRVRPAPLLAPPSPLPPQSPPPPPPSSPPFQPSRDFPPRPLQGVFPTSGPSDATPLLTPSPRRPSSPRHSSSASSERMMELQRVLDDFVRSIRESESGMEDERLPREEWEQQDSAEEEQGSESSWAGSSAASSSPVSRCYFLSAESDDDSSPCSDVEGAPWERPRPAAPRQRTTTLTPEQLMRKKQILKGLGFMVKVAREDLLVMRFYEEAEALHPRPFPSSRSPSLTTSAHSLPSSGPSLPSPGPSLPTSARSLPTSARSLPTSAPSLPTSAPSLPTSAPSLPTSAPSLPTSAPSLPTSAPSLPTSAPSLPTSAPSLPTSAPSLPSVSSSPSQSAPSVSSLPVTRRNATRVSRAPRDGRRVRRSRRLRGQRRQRRRRSPGENPGILGYPPPPRVLPRPPPPPPPSFKLVLRSADSKLWRLSNERLPVGIPSHLQTDRVFRLETLLPWVTKLRARLFKDVLRRREIAALRADRELVRDPDELSAWGGMELELPISWANIQLDRPVKLHVLFGWDSMIPEEARLTYGGERLKEEEEMLQRNLRHQYMPLRERVRLWLKEIEPIFYAYAFADAQ